MVKAEEAIAVLMQDLKSYLFPGSIQFIESINRQKYDLFLITVGGIEFQQEKVRNSGIEELIGESNCIYTTEAKEDALHEYINQEELFYLLEDKAETIRKVQQAYPNAVVFEAANGDIKEYNDPEELLLAPNEGEKVSAHN